jgi:hypothetical protein
MLIQFLGICTVRKWADVSEVHAASNFRVKVQKLCEIISYASQVIMG